MQLVVGVRVSTGTGVNIHHSDNTEDVGAAAARWMLGKHLDRAVLAQFVTPYVESQRWVHPLNSGCRLASLAWIGVNDRDSRSMEDVRAASETRSDAWREVMDERLLGDAIGHRVNRSMLSNP